MHYPSSKKPAGAPSYCREAERGSLVDLISLTAEICGQPLSAPAVEMLADDLSLFDDAAICSALARCRLELRGPLRLGDILERIDDGRPDADEAWAMIPADEHDSVVWTEEMAQAWGIALPLLNAGDAAKAQSVFRNAYEKSVLEARVRREPPRWTPSLGLDASGREMALREAVTKGRATQAQASQLLGHRLDMPMEENEFAQGDIKSPH